MRGGEREKGCVSEGVSRCPKMMEKRRQRRGREKEGRTMVQGGGRKGR